MCESECLNNYGIGEVMFVEGINSPERVAIINMSEEPE